MLHKFVTWTVLKLSIETYRRVDLSAHKVVSEGEVEGRVEGTHIELASDSLTWSQLVSLGLTWSHVLSPGPTGAPWSYMVCKDHQWTGKD